MTHEPFSRRAPWTRRRTDLGMARPWAALAVLLAGSAAYAQSPPPAGEVVPAYAQSIINGTDGAVVPAGCASCGGGLPAPYITNPVGGGGCGGACACSDDSCASCLCKPGKTNQCACGGGCSDCFLGRLGGGFIQCICCPDACYEGCWNYTANAAFFQDTVRPQTYTRLQWDNGQDVTTPDRAEFYWAKTGAKGPPNTDTRVNYNTLSLYQEVAAGNFGFFVNTPYTRVDPDNDPDHANFGDISLGTKTLLLDCDLMQMSFQFRTYIPSANSRNGLGTGHTSLEPSLLASIKVMEDTYLQGQVAYWIPLGGDGDDEGATWWYGLSLNRQWFKRGPFALISTAEFNGWTFTDGAYTTAAGTPARAETTYITLGGGMRLVICDKFDIGFGSSFAVTDNHFADQLYRTEFRVRY